MAVSASLLSVENLLRKNGQRDGNGAIGKLDAKALQHELARGIEGEVRFDRASIGLYATDSSNFREIPIGVVVPRTYLRLSYPPLVGRR